MTPKENEPDIVDDAMKSVDAAITKARDIGWNKAIDEATRIFYDYCEGDSIGNLIDKLKALKK